MKELTEKEKARIVAERIAKVQKREKAIEKQKKSLARKARLANSLKKISKHDEKPKLSPEDKEKLQRQFLRQLRSAEAQQMSPELYGMVIGMMVAGAKTPEMKALVIGLSGLEINEK